MLMYKNFIDHISACRIMLMYKTFIDHISVCRIMIMYKNFIDHIYFHQPFYAEVINRDGNIKSDTSKFIKSLINLIRYIL
jgi:hypothetical protein